jgi:frataxin
MELVVTVEEPHFHAIADRTLETLVTALDLALGDELDVDLQGGILTVELPAGGQFVVNKNGPLRQIWLASPRSGGWHFDWHENPGEWRSSRDPAVSLQALLAEELGAVTGRTVDLAKG